MSDIRTEIQEPTPAEAALSFEEMLSRLEYEIGYFFRDRKLLRRALTHRSYANEQGDPRPPHNEALEFLGDAVLEFLISAWLLELYPTQTEGTLSKMRAYTVSAVNLQKQAARLRLGNYLLLNRGEEKTGGRNKMALLVDSYEALLAAIYLDRGIEAAKDFVRREFADTLAEIDPQDLTATDYKTALQERLQSVGLPTPHYAIVESLGPDHRRVFRVELRVNGQCFATGEGATIKGAHQAAARTALDIFESEIEKIKESHHSVEVPMEQRVNGPAVSPTLSMERPVNEPALSVEEHVDEPTLPVEEHANEPTVSPTVSIEEQVNEPTVSMEQPVNEPTVVEAPPVEKEGRIPITDTIF